MKRTIALLSLFIIYCLAVKAQRNDTQYNFYYDVGVIGFVKGRIGDSLNIEKNRYEIKLVIQSKYGKCNFEVLKDGGVIIRGSYSDGIKIKKVCVLRKNEYNNSDTKVWVNALKPKRDGDWDLTRSQRLFGRKRKFVFKFVEYKNGKKILHTHWHPIYLKNQHQL